MIRRERLKTNLVFAACVVLCLTADLWSKSYVSRRYGYTEFQGAGHDVIPGFVSIWYKQNAGGVFGVGQGKAPLFVVFTAVALAALAWLFLTTDRSQHHLNIGIACITAGALGNLYDRLFNAGKVRDFIDCYIGLGKVNELLIRWFGTSHWYTFNIADACICVGVGLLMVDVFLGERQAQDTTEESSAKEA